MNGFMGSVVSIIGLFTGVAIVASLVSKNATTGSLISAGFSGIAQDIGAATAPLTGSSFGTGTYSGLNIGG